MKQPATLSRAELRIVADALASLQEKAAIDGKLAEPPPASSGTYQADAAVDFFVADGTSRYLVECKTQVDRKVQLDQVRRQLESGGSPGLLIAPYLSKELAEYCRATGLQFLDTCGNAYLRAPGLFVLISGEKNEPRHRFARAPSGLTNMAGLKVAFALLAKPELINAGFKDIAGHAGVSLGAAHNTLADLQRRGYVISKAPSTGRRLLEPRRLIDEWLINYPAALRPKLHARRFSAAGPDWWNGFDAGAFDSVWGCEVAASRMTGYLKPSTQTLYVPSEAMELLVGTLVKRYRVRPDPDGEIEVLEKFWQWPASGPADIAPPLLVCSDLLATLDPRAQETANMIRERYIEPMFDQA